MAFSGPGGVAQLGERLNGIQEVRGSIPLASIGYVLRLVTEGQTLVADCSVLVLGAGAGAEELLAGKAVEVRE